MGDMMKNVQSELDDLITELVETQNKIVDIANRLARMSVELTKNLTER